MVGYADQVTLALELRGFSPAAQRTCRRPPRFHRRDAAFLTLVLLVAGAAGWLQWSGGTP
jgi:energy-coupling factor transporter transmembrane protein EcfT